MALERFAPGARVVNELNRRRATVVVRPFKMAHESDCTPVVLDGDPYVTYWKTNSTRELVAADDEPTMLEKFRA